MTLLTDLEKLADDMAGYHGSGVAVTGKLIELKLRALLAKHSGVGAGTNDGMGKGVNPPPIPPSIASGSPTPSSLAEARKATDGADGPPPLGTYEHAERLAADAYTARLEERVRELERSRDGWESDAMREGKNVEFWRSKCTALESALKCPECGGSGVVYSKTESCAICGHRSLLYYPDGCPTCSPIRNSIGGPANA